MTTKLYTKFNKSLNDFISGSLNSIGYANVTMSLVEQYERNMTVLALRVDEITKERDEFTELYAKSKRYPLPEDKLPQAIAHYKKGVRLDKIQEKYILTDEQIIQILNA